MEQDDLVESLQSLRVFEVDAATISLCLWFWLFLRMMYRCTNMLGQKVRVCFGEGGKVRSGGLVRVAICEATGARRQYSG